MILKFYLFAFPGGTFSTLSDILHGGQIRAEEAWRVFLNFAEIDI